MWFIFVLSLVLKYSKKNTWKLGVGHGQFDAGVNGLMFMPEISNRMVFVNGKHPRYLQVFNDELS